MSKQSISIEIGKDKIHDGHYVITQTGHTVKIEAWAHGAHGIDTYKVKGVGFDQFDAGQVADRLKKLVEGMQRVKQMMKRLGIDRIATAAPANEVKPASVSAKRAPSGKPASNSNPLSKIQV